MDLLVQRWTHHLFRALMTGVSEVRQSVSLLMTNCTILGGSSSQSSLSSSVSAFLSMVWRQARASCSNSSRTSLLSLSLEPVVASSRLLGLEGGLLQEQRDVEAETVETMSNTLVTLI